MVFGQTNSIPKAEKLRIASVSEVKSLFGEPEIMEGPLDQDGTVVWLWRICSLQAERLKVTEFLIGFKPVDKSSILFAVTRTGLGKLALSK